MKVTVIDHTQNGIETIYRAFRICYSKDNPTEIKIPSKEKMIEFIKAHINHESPTEHATISFAIEGVSRALTHQLVRHRIASYSQQSQRYVCGDNFGYVVPPEIEKIPEAKEIYIQTIDNSQKAYSELRNILLENGRSKEQASEDARYVFANATESNIIVTMNVRSLFSFFGERCCIHAQWEIREMANKMLFEANKVFPLFDKREIMKCNKTCFDCSK